MRFNSIIAAAAFTISTASAFSCQSNLNPYCCESATNYPRGYAGNNCANATIVEADDYSSSDNSTAVNGTSDAAQEYTCENTVQQVFICCQRLEVLGTNPNAVAYYCGVPLSK